MTVENFWGQHTEGIFKTASKLGQLYNFLQEKKNVFLVTSCICCNNDGSSFFHRLLFSKTYPTGMHTRKLPASQPYKSYNMYTFLVRNSQFLRIAGCNSLFCGKMLDTRNKWPLQFLLNQKKLNLFSIKLNFLLHYYKMHHTLRQQFLQGSIKPDHLEYLVFNTISHQQQVPFPLENPTQMSHCHF